MRLRFEKALALLLLMGGLVFVPSLLWAEETSSDEEVSDEVIEQTENTAASIPSIEYLDEEGSLLIRVYAVNITDVQGFMWNGTNASELVSSFIESGMIELKESATGFDLLIHTDIDSLAEENPVFGMIMHDGSLISKQINKAEIVTSDDKSNLGDAISLLDNAVFGLGDPEDKIILTLGLFLIKPNCSFYKCRKRLKGARTEIELKNDKGNYKKYTTISGKNADGRISLNIKGYCNDIQMVTRFRGKDESGRDMYVNHTTTIVAEKQNWYDGFSDNRARLCKGRGLVIRKELKLDKSNFFPFSPLGRPARKQVLNFPKLDVSWAFKK